MSDDRTTGEPNWSASVGPIAEQPPDLHAFKPGKALKVGDPVVISVEQMDNTLGHEVTAMRPVVQAAINCEKYPSDPYWREQLYEAVRAYTAAEEGK